MSKSGNKCAQVKRLLNANKPVTGELLEFTLSLMPDPGPNGGKHDETWAAISRKLRAGDQLGEYEHHLMVDVVLLHVRLKAATTERLESEGED